MTKYLLFCADTTEATPADSYARRNGFNHKNLNGRKQQLTRNKKMKGTRFQYGSKKRNIGYKSLKTTLRRFQV